MRHTNGCPSKKKPRFFPFKRHYNEGCTLPSKAPGALVGYMMQIISSSALFTNFSICFYNTGTSILTHLQFSSTFNKNHLFIFYVSLFDFLDIL